MKQKLLNLAGGLLLGMMLLTGCKKDIQPLPSTVTEVTEDNFLGINSCRLTTLWYSPDAYIKLHYNARGLADQWVTHYDETSEEQYDILYDFVGRMKSAIYTYNGEFQNRIRFYYTGLRLTKEVWYDASDDVTLTVYDSYNWQGQLVKRENTSGVKVIFFNNFIGNTPKIQTYLDGVLSAEYEYTFYQPNKNPFKTITGIPFGFPYNELNFTTYWETSEKGTEFTDGVATVIYADDPSQTVLQFGNRHSLESIFDYDYINDESRTTSFDYEHCGGAGDENTGTNNYRTPVQGLKSGRSVQLEFSRAINTGKSAKEIRDNLNKMKQSLKK